METITSTRRTFIKTSALAASSLVLPRFTFGQEGPLPTRKLNIAFIGSGGIASSAFSGCDGENYVALCDVDDSRVGSTYAKYPQAKRFKDFREMLDKVHLEIDAVVVSTPDHTHFAAAFLAMQAGKHIYVQKPLTHNIWQARTLRRAAQRYKVVTQMGNQGTRPRVSAASRNGMKPASWAKCARSMPGTVAPISRARGIFASPPLFHRRQRPEDPIWRGIFGWDRRTSGPVARTICHSSGGAGGISGAANWVTGLVTRWMRHSGRWVWMPQPEWKS